MAPAESTLASGVRSVAVAGDITNSVIVTGDDVTIELRVDTDDALLANLLEGARVPRRTRRPLPLDGVPPPAREHVDRAHEAATLRAAIRPGATFDLTGPREIGKTFVVRHALAGGAGLPDGAVYVFAKGKRYGDVLQELHEAFIACEPPAVAGEQQIRRDLAGAGAVVVLDGVELERDELRQLAAILPGCHLVLVARERALGEGGRLAVLGLAADDALALVEQELGRALEEAERPAAAELCARLGGHPFELRQAAADVREGERSFTQLAAAVSSAVDGEGDGAVAPVAGEAAPAASGALADLLLGSLSAQDAAIVELLAAMRGATVGAEHLAALAGVDDLTPALRALAARRLIASASPRFRIAGALHEDGRSGPGALHEDGRSGPGALPERAAPGPDALDGQSAPGPGAPLGQPAPGPGAVTRATAHFASWAQRQRPRPARVLTEAPALLELIGRAEAEGRDADVIALGRASDAAFAHGRRWATWRAVLEAVHGAGERSGDDGSRAWALHQLGTRAYCLGEVAAAVATLQEALRLRERIGDEAGAAATRHNLDFIASPPVDGDGDGGGGSGGGGPATRRSLGLVVALVAVVAALGAGVAIGLGGGGDDPAAPTPTGEPPIVTDPVIVPQPPPPVSTTATATVPTATQTQTTTTPPPVAPPPPPPVAPPVVSPPVAPPPPPPGLSQPQPPVAPPPPPPILNRVPPPPPPVPG